jgi:hypothetical protein
MKIQSRDGNRSRPGGVMIFDFHSHVLGKDPKSLLSDNPTWGEDTKVLKLSGSLD